MPTFGSLFSGIGGFDLGLERAGWECRWQVEIDPFCRRVLARHWPHVARHGDIRTLDLERLERVDLICGGFPCQPVSLAGKGLAQADARWLWPEFARVVRALRPRFVLVENVPGLLGRGFGDVVGDLAAGGYDAEWDCIPASAVGAPHRRDRVWLVAYARNAGQRLQPISEFGGSGAPRVTDDGAACTLADTRPVHELALGKQAGQPQEVGRQQYAAIAGECSVHAADAHGRRLEERTQRDGGSQSSIFGHGPFGNDAFGRGLSAWWATEPDVGRVAHGVPQRVDRLRGLGNAIVPQIAEWIGRRLMETYG